MEDWLRLPDIEVMAVLAVRRVVKLVPLRQPSYLKSPETYRNDDFIECTKVTNLINQIILEITKVSNFTPINQQAPCCIGRGSLLLSTGTDCLSGIRDSEYDGTYVVCSTVLVRRCVGGCFSLFTAGCG